MGLRQFVSDSAKSQNKTTPNSTIYKGVPVEDFTVASRINCAARIRQLQCLAVGHLLELG